jgi:hypothetical protein
MEESEEQQKDNQAVAILKEHDESGKDETDETTRWK